MADKSADQDQKKPDSRSPSNNGDDLVVVGIGASAGGIQALKEFFSKVSAQSGIAYVVILHMSPEHESKLAEVLQTATSLPVTQVRGRIKVEPNHVYVIPPNQNLAMNDGHLALTNVISTEERRSPVDLFFRTLAKAKDSRAVSVILSGTGTNGSVGLKTVKEYGGVVFAQDPLEAQYSDMPQNAIATGLVDYVLPVSDIPARISSYEQHRGSVPISEPHDISDEDEEGLRDVLAQLRTQTGHDFLNYKRATILRRIERRMGLKEISSLRDYAGLMQEDKHEPKALLKDLLISVTNFFRDPEAIEALAATVVPAILQRKDENDFLRVWVAGCATGEEAYSIAMVLSEALLSIRRHPQIQIFATDLDAEAIGRAREGFYSEGEVSDVSPERLRRFFLREPEGYRIRREIRELVLFAVHNLTKDPPFSHLDLISCRNVLIYLNRTAQSRALEVMHFALNSGAYLFLGSSEWTEAAADLFSIVDKENHIFQSRPVPTRAILPLAEIALKTPSLPWLERQRTPQEAQAVKRLSYLELHQQLLEQFSPPSVVVNEEQEIVHMSDGAGRYMRVGGGEPSNNLLSLVRPELRLELRTALYQSIQNQQDVETSEIQVQTDDGTRSIRLIVRPVFRQNDGTRGFVLVVFDEGENHVPAVNLREQLEQAEPITTRLEQELKNAKAQLRATVEQYEIQQEELRASNEELQAMNEELRSSTEELETSKEELQSINEELSTVNQELEIKIEELSHSNNDFANLINSTDIGTIFLDRGLRVKMFTPRACDTVNLIGSDINRPLLHITHKLAYGDLQSDIDEVVRTLHKVEREVQTLNGHWFLMRVLPYRTSEDRIDGIVLTFLDITDSKTAKNELEQARGNLEVKVEERTSDLRTANIALTSEVAERRRSELARVKVLGQLVNAQEAERRRLARDLHDHLGQQITALRLKLENIKEGTSTRKQLDSDIGELLNITEQLDSDIDFLAWELRPFALDDLGLPEALRVYITRWAEHFDIPAEFHTSGFEDLRIAPTAENHLYRIAQEALNNVAKHSRTSKVEILLERREDNAVLIVEDKGVGMIETPQLHQTMGLSGMRERAMLLNGSFEIEFAPNDGTTIFVRIPINSDTAKSGNDNE